jgi:hypothetical protein
MKLRIRGNSIRFRLTQSEVAALGRGLAVEETTDFGGDQRLVYSIVPTESENAIEASFADGRLEILISRPLLSDWAENGEIGIDADQGRLKINIEKDFACLVPRAPEEDADAFPHPRTNTAC